MTIKSIITYIKSLFITTQSPVSVHSGNSIKGIVHSDNWTFEIIQVRARKVAEFGESYSATGAISIANGEVHIEALISSEKLTRKDLLVLHHYIRKLGYSYYVTSTFKHNQRVLKKVMLNKENNHA